ncbi:Hypothetical protein A7982_03286 [Minicystis rosea]|nr:Hypothetical protein A7982_03286 [Minicystis rosea]
MTSLDPGYRPPVKLRRASALLSIILLTAGCSDDPTQHPVEDAGASGDGGVDDPTSHWHIGDGPLAPISGKAFLFGPTNGEMLVGAKVSVAEAPEHQTTVAADGTFAFEVPSGAPVSFVIEQAGFHPNQSATLAIDPKGIEMLGFQVPTESTFDLLANFADIEPDPTRCQITTTVSRAGTEPYGGSGLGEPDVVVTIDPPLPSESGPVYFEYVNESLILPLPSLTATSLDGGVIFANVPPGEYALTATKQGKQFSTVAIRCRAGLLINAAPPHGLQEL